MAFVQKGAVASAYGSSSCTATLTGTTAGNHAQLKIVWANPNNTARPAASGWTHAVTAGGFAALTGGGYSTGSTIYYLENLAGGTLSILVDGTSGAWAIDAFIEEHSGLATSSSLDQTQTGGATGSNTSGSLTTATTTVANETISALIAGPQVNSAANIGISDPPSSGYTSDYLQQNNQTHAVGDGGYKLVAATGTQSASWTWTQVGEWAAVIATFKASGVALASQTATFSQGTFGVTNSTPTAQIRSAPPAPLLISKALGPLGLGGFALRVNVTPQVQNIVSISGQTSTFTQGTFTASSTGGATMGSQTVTFSQGTFTSSSSSGGTVALGSQTATFTQGTMTIQGSGPSGSVWYNRRHNRRRN